MQQDMADDLLLGAKAISQFLGMTERQVFHFAETKALPLFKIRKLWAGRKSTLREHIAKLEQGRGGEAA